MENEDSFEETNNGVEVEKEFVETNEEKNSETEIFEDEDEENIEEETNNFFQKEDFEESEEKAQFSLIECSYSSKKYEIDSDSYDVCKSYIEENAYVFIVNQSDLLSKFFTNDLLQSIDLYGKIEKKEIIIDEDIIDFINLKNYILENLKEHILIFDICKINHLQKESFFNNFYGFINERGNSVKLREAFDRNKIKLIFIAYDTDVMDNNNLNIYHVRDKYCQEVSILDNKKSMNEVEIFLDDELSDIEISLLFIIFVFKSLTPLELQEILSIVLTEEDLLEWKNNRKILLKNHYLSTSTQNNIGTVITCDSSLRGKEDEMIEKLIAHDPFFISELFDVFENNVKLFSDILLGEKSNNFTNGFFRLVERVSKCEPNKFSLEWFIKYFSKQDENFSSTYFLSLASCALKVSLVNDDSTFLDKLVNHFYKSKDFWSVIYLVEYFNSIASFDKYKWYKNLLSSIKDSDERRKLLNHLYVLIQKDIYTNPSKLEILLEWEKENNKILSLNNFYILIRLTSDAVRTNKNWNKNQLLVSPFIFENENIDVITSNYLRYIFNIQEKNIDFDIDFYENIMSENINKLFFTKILGLLKPLTINSRKEKKIIKVKIDTIRKSFEKDYRLYLILMLMEWSFFIDNLFEEKKKLNYKDKIFSLVTEKLKNEELRKIKYTIQDLSSILLKLASLTRKNKEVSSTYIGMRNLLHSIKLK